MFFRTHRPARKTRPGKRTAAAAGNRLQLHPGFRHLVRPVPRADFKPPFRLHPAASGLSARNRRRQEQCQQHCKLCVEPREVRAMPGYCLVCNEPFCLLSYSRKRFSFSKATSPAEIASLSFLVYLRCVNTCAKLGSWFSSKSLLVSSLWSVS